MKTKKQKFIDKYGELRDSRFIADLQVVINEAIAEHEAGKWKKIEADGYEKSIGWKLNYDFLKTLAENAANASGEQVQMEVAEAVLIAFRELPAPYQEGGQK